MSKISRIFTTYRITATPFQQTEKSLPLFPSMKNALAPIELHTDQHVEKEQVPRFEYTWINDDHDILATEISIDVAEKALN